MKEISENSEQEEINGLEEYNLHKKRKTLWTAAACVLAVVMIVGISFALRSQGRAYTHERRILTCSYSPHCHSDGCYSDGELTCGMAEYVIHSHNDDCYDENGTLVCPLPEYDGETHTHSDGCYDEEHKLSCGKLETYEHTHGGDCIRIEEIVVEEEKPEETVESAVDAVTTPETAAGSEETAAGGTVMTETATDTTTDNSEAATGETTETENVTETVIETTPETEGGETTATATETATDTDSSESATDKTTETEIVTETTTETAAEETTEQGTADESEEQTTEQETVTEKETVSDVENKKEPVLHYDITSRTYEDDEIKVEVSYPASARIPDEAELVVKNLTGRAYKDALAQAEDALEDAKFDAGAYAYDISFIYDGKEMEPENGNVTVTFHFKEGAYEDGDDLTIIHLGDTQTEIIEGVEVNDGKSAVEIDSFSPYIFGTTRPVDAQDISESVENIEFSTREGSIWVKKNKDADGQYSFNSDDSIKAELSCKHILVSKLGSVAYIPLPKSMSLPSKMVGQEVEYRDKDYNGAAGTYQLLYDTDGTPCASFLFTDDYLKWIRRNRGGYIDELYFEFEFTWDVGQTDGSVKDEKIHLGSFDGTVKIKTKNESNNSDQKLGYHAAKNVKETKYEKGKMIITYEVYVNVESHQDKAIELNDTITRGTTFDNLEWEYSGKGGKHADDYVKLTVVSDTEKTITIGDQNGADEGTYTIRYTASFDVGDLQNAKVDSVKNTIVYGDDKYHSSTEMDTRMNPMSKNGHVENVNTGEVRWTVRVNDGRVPYTFGEGESFTDTLPAGTSLVDGTMKIIQYDANWTETGNTIDWHAEKRQDGTTVITVKFPQGAYRYQIEYMTIQDEPPEPGVETKVENKAQINGDLEYETSAGVTLKPDEVTKTMGEVLTKSKQYFTTPDGTKREVFEIAWSVMLASVKANEEYTDRGLDASWVVPLLMSSKQIEGIVVKCGENTLAAGTDYVITSPDGSGEFLFKIKFLKDQKEKVTIDYTCYADVTDVKDGGFNVRNVFGSVEAGGWIDKKYPTPNSNIFKYVKGSNVDEYGNRFTDSSIAIGMNKTLNWVIVAEPKYIPESPLVFKDTLPKGLRFVDSSLKIKADWGIDIGAEYYRIEKETGADSNEIITLTIDLAGKTVGWKDYGVTTLDRLEITYDTLITDTDFLTGNEQSTVYTNTVEWDGNDVEQNVTVTRDVIGKYGSFDENTGMLKYSVIINPDSAKLNPDGSLLRVEDILTDRRGVEFKLDGVKLYDLTDASGGTGKVPGQELATLERLSGKPADDGSAKENTYYYDENTCTITAFIPDETACALVYGYQVMSDIAEDIYVSNKASLYGGSKSFGSTQESTKVLKFSLKAGGITQAVALRIEKHDAAYYDKLLANAEFEVSRWNETEHKWVADEENNPYRTDENGSVALSSLAMNVVYKVVETKAPENYEINPQIKYFAFAEKLEDVLAIPDGVNREYIELYPYGEDIPPSVIEWKDRRMRTDLLVEKKWVDGSQHEIERINGVLKFDLYRKKIPRDQMPDSIEGRTLIYKLTDAELETIKTDYAGYKAAHEEEYVAEYTLDSSQTNGVWKLVIPDLEQIDVTGEMVYQYYLVETSVDTLSGNDQWLKAEYEETFDKDDNQGGIIITNTIVSEYALPETGGTGSWRERVTKWFQERYQGIVHYFRKEEK